MITSSNNHYDRREVLKVEGLLYKFSEHIQITIRHKQNRQLHLLLNKNVF